MLCRRWGGKGTIYPDTLLPITNSTWKILKQRTIYFHSIAYFENIFIENQVDTICMFVINEEAVNTYGWDKVREDYLILVRYDFSLSDLESLDFSISYPPGEEMKNIKMYPPYDTYK